MSASVPTQLGMNMATAKLAAQALVVSLLGWWICAPFLHGDWVTDDQSYIVANPLLHRPDRLWLAWFVPGSFVEYYPIEQTVQWLQWKAFGLDPFGYHVTNVVLHVINALLLWRLLAKLGLRFAWVGALIFVAHPAMIESVAWISELKNTLSLAPFLVALCFWVDYEEQKRPRDYACALGFFFVAMLCKITMAPFCAFIFLYAWWKRGRITRADVVAAIPFLVISLVLAYVTLWAGQVYAQTGDDSADDRADTPVIGGLAARVALAGTTLAFYLWRWFWPFWNVPVYPQWKIDPPTLLNWVPWILCAIFVGWLWQRRQKWSRHVLLGFGFFALFLLPFSGLKSISYMKASW